MSPHKRHRNVLDAKRDYKPCVEHARAPLCTRLLRAQDWLDLVVPQESREEAYGLCCGELAAYAAHAGPSAMIKTNPANGYAKMETHRC